MNNEPVAWMSELGTCYHIDDIAQMDKTTRSNFTIPLYTHPAKTLTDEEIMECKAHVEVMYGCLAPLEFAWLILRKAQEK